MKVINAISAKIWKVRFAAEFHRQTAFNWAFCWESATIALDDMLDGDFTEMEPVDAVNEELSNWD